MRRIENLDPALAQKLKAAENLFELHNELMGDADTELGKLCKQVAAQTGVNPSSLCWNPVEKCWCELTESELKDFLADKKMDWVLK